MSADSTYDGVSNIDPLDMLNYVDQTVEVATVYGEVIKGTVVTVDPVSETYVLANNSVNLTLIMGRSIKSVSLINEQSISFNIKGNPKTSKSGETNRQCESALHKLKEWLEKNLVPIEVDNGILKIGDMLFIHPPYRAENVFSSNEMVLHKILGIIERMPRD